MTTFLHRLSVARAEVKCHEYKNIQSSLQDKEEAIIKLKQGSATRRIKRQTRAATVRGLICSKTLTCFESALMDAHELNKQGETGASHTRNTYRQP